MYIYVYICMCGRSDKYRRLNRLTCWGCTVSLDVESAC